MIADTKLITALTLAVVFVATVSTLLYYRHSGVVHGRSSSPTLSGNRPNTPSVVDVEALYRDSELAKYSAKHGDKLQLARRERKTECGSIKSASAFDCDICVLVVDELLGLVKKGSTQDDVVEFAIKACIDFKIEDERVCKAAVSEFKDELFGTLINLAYEPHEDELFGTLINLAYEPHEDELFGTLINLAYETHEVCGMVLGSECGPPWNPELMWNVTLPDTPKPAIVPPSLPKPGSPTLRVLHITDFHFDAEYKAGTNAECGEPLCCREDDGPPASGVAGAGKYGDYRNCDTAKTTLDSLFQHLADIQDQFDYVIFTGDIPAHNVWDQSRSDQISALQNYVSYMKKYLPNKMVFNTLGNHESAPVNSFPPPFVTGNNSESWFYNALVPAWRQWLPQETETTIKRGGFYSVSPFPGLRIISLNMNMCNNGNWWLYVNATDPAGMLQWFISELQAAEDKGDKVHILGHIMPGCDCCLKPFSWNYYKIINRYESTIVEQFFGHSHANYWLMFYDEQTLLRPLGVAYIPGSITTYSFLNPGYRIYEIDGNYAGSSWRVQDYTNYFLNLTDANMGGDPVWQKEYSAKEEYGLPTLFPKDWNELIYKMKTDDELYWKFCSHFVKSAPNNCTACTGLDCKVGALCELKTGRNGDPDVCRDLYD